MTDKLLVKLKTMLNRDRFQHSIGVQQTAIKLAEVYKADKNKASIAGLIHDCAKGKSGEELLRLAYRYGIRMKDLYKRQPDLLHGPVGSILAQKEFGIEDVEIIHAIKYHTTGCENMSLMDKIIYIADYIEPGRDFPGVEELRALAFKNLNEGILKALDNTIKHVIDKKQLLDDLTISARNNILMKLLTANNRL